MQLLYLYGIETVSDAEKVVDVKHCKRWYTKQVCNGYGQQVQLSFKYVNRFDMRSLRFWGQAFEPSATVLSSRWSAESHEKIGGSLIVKIDLFFFPLDAAHFASWKHTTH